MQKKMMKKQLIIFTLVAFAVPYLLGIVMGIGYQKGIDLTVFPSAQMYYPAAGVMLAALLTRKNDDYIPKRFFIGYIINTLIMVIMAVVSVFIPAVSWLWPSQIVMMGGTIILLILMLTEKKEKREAYGLKGKNWKGLVFVSVLFLVLYLIRAAASYFISGQTDALLAIVSNSQTWILLLSVVVSYFLAFIPFFGEEYGWRYYLQPIMQKRFGAVKGVILLGVLWGIWHLPINFFYYASPAHGIMSVLAQIITCITLGIFFAYGYMKTNNIWLPVILHYMNNNLVPVITGDVSADVLQNQQVGWQDLLFLLVVNGILFLSFALAGHFRKKEYQLPTMNERADRICQEASFCDGSLGASSES